MSKILSPKVSLGFFLYNFSLNIHDRGMDGIGRMPKKSDMIVHHLAEMKPE